MPAKARPANAVALVSNLATNPGHVVAKVVKVVLGSSRAISPKTIPANRGSAAARASRVGNAAAKVAGSRKMARISRAKTAVVSAPVSRASAVVRVASSPRTAVLAKAVAAVLVVAT